MLIAFSTQAQKTNNITSKIEKVTVFLNGAQITRNFKAKMVAGTQTLTTTDLSPYLDAKTIQVKGNGNFTILTIRHQMNYIDEKELEGELEVLADSKNYY